MASIVDSIRSVYQDNYALLKLGIFSYMIYMLYSLTVVSESFNILNLIMYTIVFYIYLGFSSIIISNRINQRIQSLPTFNMVYFFSIATKAFSIAIPYLIVGYFVVNFVVGMFNFEGVPQLIAIWLIRFFIFSILVTSLINFAGKYNAKDGLNFSSILSGLADVLVYTIVSMLIIAVYSIFIVVPTLYLIYSFFDIGPLFKYFAVFFITLNIAFLSDFWGQLHFDLESKNSYY